MSTYNKDLIIITKLWILKSEFLTCFAHRQFNEIEKTVMEYNL